MSTNHRSFARLQNISQALALLLVVQILPTALAKINPGRCCTTHVSKNDNVLLSVSRSRTDMGR